VGVGGCPKGGHGAVHSSRSRRPYERLSTAAPFIESCTGGTATLEHVEQTALNTCDDRRVTRRATVRQGVESAPVHAACFGSLAV